jgi:hypothetical protein
MSGPAAHAADRPAARRPRRQLYTLLASGALLAGALGYIGVADPHRPDSFFPLCPFRLLTGWSCPACGGLRMIHDVLHGDLAAAVNDNVLLLVGIPMLVGWILLRRHQGRWPLTLPVGAAVVITLLAWTVVRNLPGFPWVPTLLTR